MNISKIIKKAMIDNDIDGAPSLEKLTGLSLHKCYRLLHNDKSVRLQDALVALNALGYTLRAEVL